MTSGAATTEATRFVKRYGSASLASTALHRAGLAKAAGVATPQVLGQPGRASLEFERVVAAAPPTLEQMLGVLKHLHQMPPAGLARFDPFRRIRPRLGLATPTVSAWVSVLQAQDRARHWPGAGVIHGDFHPGQVLCDSAGKVWLVDLDDLALAPPEADFANLAAWMATQVQGPLVARAKVALAQVLAFAPDANTDLAWHFCRIALLRRALKLAGIGQPWAVQQLPLRT